MGEGLQQHGAGMAAPREHPVVLGPLRRAGAPLEQHPGLQTKGTDAATQPGICGNLPCCCGSKPCQPLA